MSGQGKRFIKAGYTTPKPLINVDGLPMVEHVLNLFPGVKNVFFVCDEKHLEETEMEKILKDICPTSKIFTISNNDKGPVKAVHHIKDHLDDKLETIISYCDYGTDWNFDRFLADMRASDYDGGIPCYRGFHPHMLGTDNYAFCKEENKRLIKIKEKDPFTNNKMNEFASNGTYYFKSGSLVKKYFTKLIDLDIKIKGEFYVSLVYNLLVEDGLSVGIFEIEKMLQWGTPYDLKIYQGWAKYFNNIQTPTPPISNPTETTLILPMAGKGSRFVEEGYKDPKPLLDIDGLPMVIQAVNSLPQSQNKIFICLDDHLKSTHLRKQLSASFPGCKIKSLDTTTDGYACTCEVGINDFNVDIEKPLMVSPCDCGVFYDKEKYLRLVNDKTIDIVVWSFRDNQTSKLSPNSYTWLDVDENDFIKYVSCKKFIYDDPLRTHAVIGTIFFRKGRYFLEGLAANYEQNIRTNGEFCVDSILNQSIKQGLNAKVFEVDNYICWGAPNDYKTYNYWLDHFKQKNNNYEMEIFKSRRTAG
tara:strand:+ start:6920 stop:8503 length:1584 start_codon:yes stop_codon:yes gene_type:complete